MIEFLGCETIAGREWLRQHGWADGEPFVCLLVRDSAFLANDPLINRLDSRDRIDKWSYHDYRDSDIDDYVPAMEWLADQGVWILRMGRIMERPMATSHPRIIDYAFDSDKSELLDIWLFANCVGCISTATGLDGIACVYGIAILFLNATPLGGLLSFHEAIWVPKHLYWAGTGSPLTLSEYLSHNYGSSYSYRDAGIEFRVLSNEELIAAVQEFWYRIDGSWIELPEDEERQNRFWTSFSAWQDFDLLHATIHPKSKVGTSWLRSMGEGFITS